ncbi:hypothetical protein Tco_0830117 [Tanacetum coccineum]
MNARASDQAYENSANLQEKTKEATRSKDKEPNHQYLVIEVWICQILQEISQKRTRERMSDQEAKEIKAEAREIMPQPSTKSTAASTVNLQSQHHSL